MNLFKIFQKPKSVEEKVEDHPIIIQLVMKEDGNLSLDVRWKTENEKIAYITGKLLYNLNDGVFKEKFVNLLKDDTNDFMGLILDSWLEEEELELKPIVSPSEFLKYGKLSSSSSQSS